jgi:hypothetical protein
MCVGREWRLRRRISLALIVAVASAGAAAVATPAQAAIFAPLFYSNAKPLTTTPVPVSLWGALKLNSKFAGEITCERDVLSGSVWNHLEGGEGRLEGMGATPCKAPVLERNECPLFLECPNLTVFMTAELPLEVEEREAEMCSDETKRELSQCPAKTERVIEPPLPLRIRRRTASLPWSLELISSEWEEESGVPVARIGLPGETCYPKEIVEGKQVAAKWTKVPAGCIRLDVVIPEIPHELVFYGELVPRLFSGAGNGLDASSLAFNKEAGYIVSENEAVPETYSEGRLHITGSEARELITAR